MTALEQLHGGLTLANAAVALQQNAFAVDLHQNAVQGAAITQMDIQRSRQGRDKAGSVVLAAQQGRVVFFAQENVVLISLHTIGQHQNGQFHGQQPVKGEQTLLPCQALQISGLRTADDLNVIGVKMLKKARQRQCRTADRTAADQLIQIIFGAVDDLQAELGNQFMQFYRIIALHWFFLRRNVMIVYYTAIGMNWQGQKVF